MRGNSFVVGGARAFPASARGTVYRGLMHLLDWHAVFAGLAGVSSPPESGKSLDAIDLWADIAGPEVSGGPIRRREEALLNLDEYLREEEIRTLIQMSDDANAREGAAAAVAGAGGALSRAKRRRQADAKRAEASDAAGKKGESFQTINGEHDNSLANGVAQRYWSFVVELCTDPEPSVRLKATHLAEVVLRQGLVHPMSCFPPLIALQADPVLTVRKLAMRLLRQQHGKYPDFFDHQLGAGLGLLFEFCKRLQAAARRAARAGGRGGSATGNAGNTGLVASAAVVNQGFTNIYKLVNGTRSTRFKFLRALLRRYEGESKGSDATYLCFLANAIGALPFTMSDEALFVIFHLNRIISLRASTLQDSLAARIAQAVAEGRARRGDGGDRRAAEQRGSGGGVVARRRGARARDGARRLLLRLLPPQPQGLEARRARRGRDARRDAGRANGAGRLRSRQPGPRTA